MSACGCRKDQTEDESIKSLNKSKNAKSELGTGIFLVPAPEKGILEKKAVLVQGLTYLECSKRGENCIAFKWIADKVMTFKNIQKRRLLCGDYCGSSGRCSDRTCICSVTCH